MSRKIRGNLFKVVFFSIPKPKVALADSGNRWATGGNGFAVKTCA